MSTLSLRPKRGQAGDEIIEQSRVITPERAVGRSWAATSAQALCGAAGIAIVGFAAFLLGASTEAAALLFLFVVVPVAIWARPLASALVSTLAIVSLAHFFDPAPANPLDIVTIAPLLLAVLILAPLAAVLLTSFRENAALTERLLLSEERYERVMAATGEGYWEWKLASDELYVSPRILEMYALPPGSRFASRADFIARIPLHPDDRPRLERAVAEYFAGDAARFEIEVRIVVRAETRWVRLLGRCTRDASGRIVRWTGSAADVTERRRAEQDLRCSEERFALAVRGAKDGIWDWDLVTGLVYLSPRGQEIQLGRPSDGVDTRHESEWRKLYQVHPEDAPRRDAAIRDHLQGRTEHYEGEWRARHPDGRYHWIHTRGICTRDASGRALRFAGSATDIDERKRGEEALRQSEERFALAVAGANEGIFDWDLVTDRVYVSQRAQELYGLPPGELWRPRRDWRHLVTFHPEDAKRLHDRLKALIEGQEQLYDEEYRIVVPGGVRWFRQRAIALRDAAGKVHRMVGSIGDITDRKVAQEELLRLERQLRLSQRLEAMGTLAGGIAHDFNNILGAILGFGEMALRDAPRGSRLRRDVDCIMTAGERGRALVDRVLAFSRSGVGKRAAVHVERVVREALDQLEAKLPPGIRAEARLHAGRAAMLGDATQVHQVLMNLGTNAVQAMPAGGILSVSLDAVRSEAERAATIGRVAVGDYIVLAVADTGSGIPGEIIERIFDPFFTTKEVGTGTGLGLSLVHGIVADLGGAIDVTSAPGQGSEFTVYLPRSGDAPDLVDDEEDAAPRGEGQRVLVVDDEEPLVRLATRTLEELGYLPTGFTSSTAALEAFRADPARFDALITDERMPGMTGTALIREVRDTGSAIPILLISGFTHGAVARTAREAGADDVLKKPLLARELATSLARVLHRQ